MKITEITDKNSSWANLSNIDFASIYSTYNTIKESWPIIIGSKSPTLIQVHKNNLTSYLNLLTNIIDKLDYFPDTEDSDLLRIKTDLVSIKTYIDNLL
jgi:hypothetical protein